MPKFYVEAMGLKVIIDAPNAYKACKKTLCKFGLYKKIGDYLFYNETGFHNSYNTNNMFRISDILNDIVDGDEYNFK